MRTYHDYIRECGEYDVVVEVRDDGVVDAVYKPDSDEEITPIIINWGNLEDGYCPICGGYAEIDSDYNYICDKCDINWGDGEEESNEV